MFFYWVFIRFWFIFGQEARGTFGLIPLHEMILGNKFSQSVNCE